ncbi:MAG: 50S ribosomal protein L9 [Planctomycetota bacterium]
MKTIELLLVENVDNLGIVGDVVKVKPGYARNYLLPMQLAEPPSDERIAALADRRKQVEAELATLRAKHEKLVADIAEFELTMQRSHNDQGILYGGVSQHDIAEALREEGYAVEDRFVRIGEQIKRLDTYTIPVVIDKELKAEVKLWVVSDRPAEELAELEGREELEIDDEGEVVEKPAAAESTDAPAEEATPASA